MNTSQHPEHTLQLPVGDDRASASGRASYETAEHGVNEKGSTKAHEFDVYGDEDTADSTSIRLCKLCYVLIFQHLVKYRTMVWWKAAALMLAETVSLGVGRVPHTTS